MRTPDWKSGDIELYLGDCSEILPDLEDGSVDAVVTDPPYGLSFMGKRWDYDVPSVAMWRECLRVLKPGGHMLTFGGTRTQHRMMVNIEDAGFDIRDCVMWVYGSGLPKSLNVGKAINKIRADDQWDGWGTALKPAWEPIIVTRKPFDGTVAANVLKHGTGALNIDGCRVDGTNIAGGRGTGRWPANIIHDGSDDVVELFPYSKDGVAVNRNRDATKHSGNTVYGKRNSDTSCDVGYGGSGSAARFFYCAKVGKREREGNDHPTVKPIALMQYLCRLVTPPDGVVLDPFMGSGTTALACRRFIGIEASSKYFEIAVQRIKAQM